MIELPTHDQITEKVGAGITLTALEQFIYDNEPVDDGQFRSQLMALLVEVKNEKYQFKQLN